MKLQPLTPGITVGILSSDADACAAFYEAVGLTSLPSVQLDGGLIRKIQVGANTLNIVQFDGPAENRPVGSALGDETGIRYWAVEVDDLNAIVETVVAAGGKVLEGPKRIVPPGHSIAMVADPDGNIIELFSQAGMNRDTEVSS